jgi:hypothetical protein
MLDIMDREPQKDDKLWKLVKITMNEVKNHGKL